MIYKKYADKQTSKSSSTDFSLGADRFIDFLPDAKHLNVVDKSAFAVSLMAHTQVLSTGT